MTLIAAVRRRLVKLLGAVVKLRRPMLVSFTVCTAARVAVRRKPKRRAVEAVLDAIIVFKKIRIPTDSVFKQLRYDEVVVVMLARCQ